MTNISHNLAGKIDETTVAILFEIDTIARYLSLPFFIVGAAARDILLQHAYDIHVMRATVDIDVGVFVSSWDQFEALKKALVSTGKFSPSRQTQRLVYDDESPVDIVPFGGIASADGSISWPPGHHIEMSVVGFRECFQNAISVQVSASPDLIVKVADLAGLAIMKFVSWDESTERRGKDAADLYLKREAGSSQGHKIAMDVFRRDPFQKEPYEKILANFNALLRGILEVDPYQ
jgi:predicted nucleotidyltransferase